MDNKIAMTEFAECVARCCFHNVMPQGAAQEIVEAIVACVPSVHDADEAVKQRFIHDFLPAVEARLAMQEQRDLA